MEDLYPMATGHGYHTSRPYIRQIHKTFLWKFQVLILRIAYYITHSAAFLKPVFHPSGLIIDDGVSASFSCTNFNGCQQFRNKKPHGITVTSIAAPLPIVCNYNCFNILYWLSDFMNQSHTPTSYPSPPYIEKACIPKYTGLIAIHLYLFMYLIISRLKNCKGKNQVRDTWQESWKDGEQHITIIPMDSHTRMS